MKQVFYIITMFCLASCSSSLNLNIPSLEFVETHIANLATENEKVRYMMRYKLSDEAPENLYARVYYQDLGNKKLFHTTSIGSIGNVKIINFYSTPTNQVMNNQHFEITLILYKDPDYTHSIGKHRDLVWFEMPATVADVLNITLL